MTYEEAIDRTDNAWVRFYEEMDFPIRDLFAGRRWFIRFKDSSQLEVMLHQEVFWHDLVQCDPGYSKERGVGP